MRDELYYKIMNQVYDKELLDQLLYTLYSPEYRGNLEFANNKELYRKINARISDRKLRGEILDRLEQRSERSSYRKRRDTGQLIKDVKEANPSDIRQVAATQLELINRYYHHVLRQAQQSFSLALVAGAVGLIFLLAAVSFFFLKQPTNISFISLISGSLVETISAINFYIYGQASKQFEAFHTYLDRINRSLIADSLCEKLIDDKTKDITRAELIKTIIRDIPPITVNRRT
ncbi:MAG TPA: hypothetical protein VIZ18_07800 [Ktedonobacteraceae bacterium]